MLYSQWLINSIKQGIKNNTIYIERKTSLEYQLDRIIMNRSKHLDGQLLVLYHPIDHLNEYYCCEIKEFSKRFYSH